MELRWAKLSGSCIGTSETSSTANFIPVSPVRLRRVWVPGS